MTPVLPPYRRGEGFGSLGVRFEEVLEPARVALWPATPGAWITLGMLALGLALGSAWFLRRQWRRRYRRAAERELSALQRDWSAARERGEPLDALPALLKRCALQGFARERVAALSGAAWLGFLDATGGVPFGEAAQRALRAITTRGGAAARRDDAERLFAAARVWIRRHHADL